MVVAKAQIDIVAKDAGFGSVTASTLAGLASLKTAMLSVSKLAIGVFAGVAGAGALLAKEAADAERGAAKLRAALGETEGADAVTQSLLAQASAIQTATTFTDDYIVSLQTVASGMGIAKDQIDNTVRAALALSAATNNMLSVEGAMRALTKASAEDEAALNRYLPQLKAVGDAAGRTAVLTETLAKGQRILQVDADTTAGRFIRLKNQLSEFAEGVGGVLLPFVNKAMTALAEAASLAAAVVATVWQDTGDALRLSADIIALAFVSTFNDIEHGLTVTLPAYVTWFSDNWVNVFSDLASAIGAIVSNMYDNLVDFFTGVFVWLQGGEFDWQWRGLLDGFESTMQALPEIARREMTALEREIVNDAVGLIVPMADRFTEKLAEFRRSFGLEKGIEGPKLPTVKLGDTGKAKKEKDAASESEAGSIVGLEELWKRIASAASKPIVEKNAADTAKATGETADNTREMAAAQQQAAATLASIDRKIGNVGVFA